MKSSCFEILARLLINHIMEKKICISLYANLCVIIIIIIGNSYSDFRASKRFTTYLEKNMEQANTHIRINGTKKQTEKMNKH